MNLQKTIICFIFAVGVAATSFSCLNSSNQDTSNQDTSENNNPPASDKSSQTANSVIPSSGKDLSKYRFHCAKDTSKIENILQSLVPVKDRPLKEVIIEAARHLEGIPYVGHTLEGESEQMVINVDGLDCVTFVENAYALAKTAIGGSTSWRDHARNLENLRYRNGKQLNFDSRLHYTTEWIADNIKRGNLTEITTTIPGYKTLKKTLNFMTTHRDLYPALENEEVFQGCKRAEKGLKDIQIPYISRYDANKPEVAEMLEDGDMISFVSNVDGLDSSHVALLRIVEGKPYMIHASLKKGRVVFETTPLHDYFRKSNRSAPGFRVVRPI